MTDASSAVYSPLINLDAEDDREATECVTKYKSDGLWLQFCDTEDAEDREELQKASMAFFNKQYDECVKDNSYNPDKSYTSLLSLKDTNFEVALA